MVCPRCVSVVREKLTGLGLRVTRVELGEAEVTDEPVDLPQVDQYLRESGFQLIFGKEEKTVEHLKAALIDYVARLETRLPLTNLSDFLAQRLLVNYPTLSKTFSHSQHLTLEKYLIRLKIERVKELLSYHELTLSEIAFRLRYSSVQALSNQFRKVTGASVSNFRAQATPGRRSLDALH